MKATDIPGERLTGDEPPDVIERHVGRYERAIGLANLIGGVWWDVGCGTGYGTELLPGDAVYGFDKQPPHGARFLVTDLRQGGWSSEAPDPDAVVCIETLEHLNIYAQDGVVAEIAQRLREGGVAVFACPIGNGPNPRNPWHVHEPSETEFRRLMGRHFHDTAIDIEHYESTSGPAVQAFAVCRRPIT